MLIYPPYLVSVHKFNCLQDNVRVQGLRRNRMAETDTMFYSSSIVPKCFS